MRAGQGVREVIGEGTLHNNRCPLELLARSSSSCRPFGAYAQLRLQAHAERLAAVAPAAPAQRSGTAIHQPVLHSIVQSC